MNIILLCCMTGLDTNSIIAILTFITLCVNVYLIIDERRPRLQFGIVKIGQAFYLKVKNVGTRTARNVKLVVEGEPIENSLFPKITDSFQFLKEHPFYVEAGAEKYFCICPDKLNHKKIDECEPWLGKDTEIPQWVEKYHSKDIHIKATYNRWFSIEECFSVQGYISLAAYKVKSPTERVVESISSINKTLKDKK